MHEISVDTGASWHDRTWTVRFYYIVLLHLYSYSFFISLLLTYTPTLLANYSVAQKWHNFTTFVTRHFESALSTLNIWCETTGCDSYFRQ